MGETLTGTLNPEETSLIGISETNRSDHWRMRALSPRKAVDVEKRSMARSRAPR
jgi:hypothetical protein